MTNVELPHCVGEPALPGQCSRSLDRGRSGPLDHDRAGPRAASPPAIRLVPRASKELREPAVCLEIPTNHHRVVRLERLGHPIDQRPREPERIADLADGRSGPIRHEVADHAGVLRPVACIDVLDDLLSPFGGEIDVDIGVGRAALVDEPLEEQVVADRIDPGDPERIGNDRIRRTPSTLRGDAAPLGELHQVPADQEELGQSGLLDNIEFVGKLPDNRRRNRVVAAANPGLAELDEIAERCLPRGYRETRKSIALEPEVNGARGGDLDGVAHALDPGPRRCRIVPCEGRVPRRHRHEVRACLQVRFAIGTAKIGECVERPPMRDGRQDVAELAILGSGVVDVVRGDDRQSEIGGDRRGLCHEPVIVGQEVMRELEEEAAQGGAVAAGAGLDPSAAPRAAAAGAATHPSAATPPEDRRVALRHCPRAGPIADQEPPSDLTIPATRQRHDALGMLGEQGLGESRNALGPGQVGVGHEPAQAAIPDGIPCQQHEVWAALPLADSAQVLLHDRSMTRQPGTLRTRTRGRTFDRARGTNSEHRPGRVGGFSWTTAAHGSAVRDHDPERIGYGSIEQLDFQPDDRVEPCCLRGSREAHHPVQAEMVGDRQPGQAEFDRPLNEVLDRGCPVKERKIGVTVELRVRELSHGIGPGIGGGR